MKVGMMTAKATSQGLGARERTARLGVRARVMGSGSG